MSKHDMPHAEATPYPEHQGESVTLSPVHLLHRAGQCADDLFSSSIENVQLTPRQFIVLESAAKLEGASQTDLVDSTGIDRSTLADIVRRLVERGLMARERTKKDARMYAVRVTALGYQTLNIASPATTTSEQRLLAAVGPEDQEAFVRSLRRIIDTFGPISSARVASKSAAPEPVGLEPANSEATSPAASSHVEERF